MFADRVRGSRARHTEHEGCERMVYWRVSALYRMGVLLEDGRSRRCFARRGLDAQSIEELVLVDVFRGSE